MPYSTSSVSYLNSIGADFKVISMNVREVSIRFQLWHLATHPRFTSIRSLYCRGAMGGIFVFPYETELQVQEIREALRELWRSCGRGVIPTLIVLLDPKSETCGEINDPENYSNGLTQLKNEFGELVSFWISSNWDSVENERCLSCLGERIIQFIYNPPMLPNEFNEIFPKKLLPRKKLLLQWLEKTLPISIWDFEKELSIVSQQGLFTINPISLRVYLTPKKCQNCETKCSWKQRYVCIDLEEWRGWNNCDLTEKELLFLAKAWVIATGSYNRSVKRKINKALSAPCVRA
ncbi:MAG: hypothetical protein ACFFDT_39675 [Candidatus Hodarchaeota archaeon]